MNNDIYIEIDGHEVLVHQDNYNRNGQEVTAQIVKGRNLDYIVREPRK
jgi:hypothetical protein